MKKCPSFCLTYVYLSAKVLHRNFLRILPISYLQRLFQVPLPCTDKFYLPYKYPVASGLPSLMETRSWIASGTISSKCAFGFCTSPLPFASVHTCVHKSPYKYRYDEFFKTYTFWFISKTILVTTVWDLFLDFVPDRINWSDELQDSKLSRWISDTKVCCGFRIL